MTVDRWLALVIFAVVALVAWHAWRTEKRETPGLTFTGWLTLTPHDTDAPPTVQQRVEWYAPDEDIELTWKQPLHHRTR